MVQLVRKAKFQAEKIFRASRREFYAYPTECFVCFLLGLLLAGASADKTWEDDEADVSLMDHLDSYRDSRGKGNTDKGWSGSAHFKAIQEYIDDKVANHSAGAAFGVSKVLEKLRAEMKTIAESPGIIYEYECCYLILDRALPTIDYFDAKALCQEQGTALGDIYSGVHYNSIISHVRKRRLDSQLSFINFWTGMKREIPSGKVFLSDGSLAPYVEPVRNSQEWSTTDSRRQHVYVSVWTDGLSHDSNPGGFGNVWPTFKRNAALCRYPIAVDEEDLGEF